MCKFATGFVGPVASLRESTANVQTVTVLGGTRCQELVDRIRSRGRLTGGGGRLQRGSGWRSAVAGISTRTTTVLVGHENGHDSEPVNS